MKQFCERIVHVLKPAVHLGKSDGSVLIWVMQVYNYTSETVTLRHVARG